MTRFPIDGTGRLSSEREHPTTVLTGPAGGDLAGSYPNPTVASTVAKAVSPSSNKVGTVYMPPAQGPGIDDAAALQAVISGLSTTNGSTVKFQSGQQYYVKSALTLPRITSGGSLHIDLNGSVIYSDQAINIFQCLVGAGDPTVLIDQCTDWEIRNGMLLGNGGVAGSRGIKIEASYNLRFRGLHFKALEIGEEVRFGLMHSDEDCRYTNNTLCGAYHGSGEAVGHTDGTVVLSGATITVPSTLGFPNAGTVTFYTTGTGNRSGASSVVTYTGKTATTFTGCTGGAGSASQGSLYLASVWTTPNQSWGCNASTHKGRHYCGAGSIAALAVHCSDGNILQAGSVLEGNNPVYDVFYDGGGVTSVNSFEQSGDVHVENTPTGAVYKLNCQGAVTLNGLNVETSPVMVDASASPLAPRIIVRDPKLFGTLTGILSTGNYTDQGWFFDGVSNAQATAILATGAWVGGFRPTKLRTVDEQRTSVIFLSAKDITNGVTGNPAIFLEAADEMELTQDHFIFWDHTAGTKILELIPGAPNKIVMPALPTSDPGVAGQLYSNGVPSAGVPKAIMVSGG